MSFGKVTVPGDADAATVWAAHREFELRATRLHRARVGIAGVMKEFTLAISGDPSLPELMVPPSPPEERLEEIKQSVRFEGWEKTS